MSYVQLNFSVNSMEKYLSSHEKFMRSVTFLEMYMYSKEAEAIRNRQ